MLTTSNELRLVRIRFKINQRRTDLSCLFKYLIEEVCLDTQLPSQLVKTVRIRSVGQPSKLTQLPSIVLFARTKNPLKTVLRFGHLLDELIKLYFVSIEQHLYLFFCLQLSFPYCRDEFIWNSWEQEEFSTSGCISPHSTSYYFLFFR